MSLNGLSGAVTLYSPNSTVGITTSGASVGLTASAGGSYDPLGSAAAASTAAIAASDPRGYATAASTAAILGGVGPVFNVKSATFGATGDGQTNDYGAIQAALNAASVGGTVYFPSGTYVCASIPSVTGSNINILGAGDSSVLQCAAASMVPSGDTIALWLNGSSNVTVQNLVFDGNFQTGAFNIAHSGGWMLPSTVSGAAFVTEVVGGANHTGTPAKGTTEQWNVSGGSSAGFFNNCVFQVGSATSGFELCKLSAGYGTNVWTVIRGYNQSPTVDLTTPALNGVANGLFDSTVTTYGTQSGKNYIFSLGVAGTIDANTYQQYAMPLRISSCSNILIEGCQIRNARAAGVQVDNGPTHSGSVSSDIMIRNCRIDSTMDNGIWFYNTSVNCSAVGNHISNTMYSGVAVVASSKASIVGNQIRNAGPVYQGDSTGIELAGCNQGIIADNLIQSCVGGGIVLLCSQESGQAWTPNQDCHVTGNTVTGSANPATAIGGVVGIEVPGATSCSIVNNRVSFCDIGIEMDNQAQDTYVHGNIVEFNNSIGIATANSDYVTGTVVEGNTIRYNGGHGCSEYAPAIWANNIITDSGGCPGKVPGATNGIQVNAAPSGLAKKQTWIIGNTISDARNNAVEIDSGFQSAGTVHIRDNTISNSTVQNYFDGVLTVAGAGASVTLSSLSCAFSGGDAGVKVVFNSYAEYNGLNAGLTGTVASVAAGVAVVHGLSNTPTDNITLTGVAFSFLTSRVYMNRGLYCDSGSSGPSEFINNQLRLLNYSTPGGTPPAGSKFQGNYETNNVNGATPDHGSGTGSFASSSVSTVAFPANGLPLTPTVAQMTITPSGAPAGLYYVSAISQTAASVSCASSGTWNYSWSIDLGR